MSPIYERTIYIDGIFEYCILENGSTYEKNYVHIMDDRDNIAEVRVGDVFPGDISDDVTYVLADQVGSGTLRLDTSGAVIDKEEYYPFGDSSLRTFSYKRYRYVGKERDQESGMYYYGARYYVAWTCRFISVDPLAADYPFYTPYNYAGNMPINNIDLDGMQGSPAPDASGGGASPGPSGTPAPSDAGPQAGASAPPGPQSGGAPTPAPQGGSGDAPPSPGSQSSGGAASAGGPGKTAPGGSKGGGGVTKKPGGSSSNTLPGGTDKKPGSGKTGGNEGSGDVKAPYNINSKVSTFNYVAKKAWENKEYIKWFENRLKAALGENYDEKKSTDAMRPYAEFLASFNPLYGGSEILGLVTTGKNKEGGNAGFGDYAEALFSVVGIKGGKQIIKGAQKVFGIIKWNHHIIPNAVYRDLMHLFDSKYFQNHIKNLKKLPAGFHWNHPAYNKWVEKRIMELSADGTKVIDLKDLVNLQQELRKHILEAFKQWRKGNGNMNTYFKKLNRK